MSASLSRGPQGEDILKSMADTECIFGTPDIENFYEQHAVRCIVYHFFPIQLNVFFFS